MSVRYHCAHTSDPSPPLPPSYRSSASSFSPLDSLYFCEECDAIRCNTCVATEIAGYMCPSCLFDVPSANVRADKNRCARHCFLCPLCSSFTEVQGTTTTDGGPLGAAGPYVLVCKGCRWTSSEVGLEFEKNAGIAAQLQKQLAAKDAAQAEFDALKEHIDGYLSTTAPIITPNKPRPTRHISHLTQMAAKALNRTGPVRTPRRENKAPLPWDEIGVYETKESWAKQGLEKGMADLSDRREQVSDVGTEQIWTSSWDRERTESNLIPQRVPLLTKLTKRCPHADCRHLLIQPDPKSSRFKIKMAAANYLPTIEVGRRRRRTDVGVAEGTAEEVDVKRKERRRMRREEEDEKMDASLAAGQVYTYQIAFTNTTADPVQIRLTALDKTLNHVFNPHLVVHPPKDAWAYEDDEVDYAEDATEGTSEDGSVMTSSKGTGTFSKKSRMSILSGSAVRKKRDPDVELKGNVTKVVVELEVPQDSRGKIEADFEVRLTYKVDVDGQEEQKQFTFWIRVYFGRIMP